MPAHFTSRNIETHTRSEFVATNVEATLNLLRGIGGARIEGQPLRLHLHDLADDLAGYP